MSGRRLVVYIAGPYTSGDVGANVATAMHVASGLIEAGFVPVCPHLFHFVHMIQQQEYDRWLEVDMELLRRCDALVRLPGDSKGADKEVALAQELGINVVLIEGWDTKGKSVMRSKLRDIARAKGKEYGY